MDDLVKILGVSFLSFVVFVVGQVVSRFVLDPIQELHKVRGEISSALIYYANVEVSQQQDRAREAASTYRKLSARLRVQVYVIPKFKLWAGHGWIPQRAAGELMKLSNVIISIRPEDDDHRVEAERSIRKLLSLEE